MGVEVTNPAANGLGVVGHLREGVPVLSPKVAELLSTPAHCLELVGIDLDLLGGEPEIVGDVGELDAQNPDALGQSRERQTVGQRGGGDTDGIERLIVDARARLGYGGAVIVCVGEQRLTLRELVILVGVVDARGVNLVELEVEQVQLAGSFPRLAAERGEL